MCRCRRPSKQCRSLFRTPPPSCRCIASANTTAADRADDRQHGAGLRVLLFCRASRALTHSFSGLFVFALPVGLAVWLFYVAVLEKATITLLSDRWHTRFAHTDAITPGLIGRAAIAIVLGAVTHILWDAFTHRGTFVTDAFPVLLGRTPGFSWLPIYHLLHGLSSVVGLVILALWARGLHRLPAKSLIRPYTDQRASANRRAQLSDHRFAARRADRVAALCPLALRRAILLRGRRHHVGILRRVVLYRGRHVDPRAPSRAVIPSPLFLESEAIANRGLDLLVGHAELRFFRLVEPAAQPRVFGLHDSIGRDIRLDLLAQDRSRRCHVPRCHCGRWCCRARRCPPCRRRCRSCRWAPRERMSCPLGNDIP